MSDTEINSLIDMEDDSDFIDPELVLQQILDNPLLLQHVSRTEFESRETITGYFRVEFEPAQQRQVLHVPFAPPMRVIPAVEANSINQQDVRVRITDRQKFGIRAEVILPSPTKSECRLLVEIIATEPD